MEKERWMLLFKFHFETEISFTLNPLLAFITKHNISRNPMHQIRQDVHEKAILHVHAVASKSRPKQSVKTKNDISPYIP